MPTTHSPANLTRCKRLLAGGLVVLASALLLGTCPYAGTAQASGYPSKGEPLFFGKPTPKQAKTMQPIDSREKVVSKKKTESKVEQYRVDAIAEAMGIAEKHDVIFLRGRTDTQVGGILYKPKEGPKNLTMGVGNDAGKNKGDGPEFQLKVDF